MYSVIICNKCGYPKVCNYDKSMENKYVFTCPTCGNKSKLRDKRNILMYKIYGSYKTAEEARQKLLRITEEFRKSGIILGKKFKEKEKW